MTMVKYQTDSGVLLTMRDVIADGGQNAAVFSVRESEDVLIKVFFEPDDMLARKLRAMVQQSVVSSWAYSPSLGIRAAWPISTILDSAGRLAGYVMPNLSDHRDLFELAEPDGAVGFHRDFTWVKLLGSCQNLAETVSGFHERGVVVGDLSPNNVLIDRSGIARLIDCDSFGFTDQSSGERFPSVLFTEDYAAPERLDGSSSEASVDSDRFSVGLLILQALAGNVSPFIALPDQVDRGLGLLDNIRSGSPTLLLSSSSGPRSVYSRVPELLRPLGEYALLQGSSDPALRPSAATWASALAESREAGLTCHVNQWHGYCAPATACPWCGPTAAHVGKHMVRPAAPETSDAAPRAVPVPVPSDSTPEPPSRSSRKGFRDWLRSLREGT